jgi:hypothetical protein
VTVASLTEIFAEGWIESPSHRQNILASYVTETGVGVATQNGDKYFAVQLFGRPRSEAIQISVRNLSGQRQTLFVEAQESIDEFDLPPRTVMRMKRCFPSTLRLSENGEGLRLTEPAELKITESGLQRAGDPVRSGAPSDSQCDDAPAAGS